MIRIALAWKKIWFSMVFLILSIFFSMPVMAERLPAQVTDALDLSGLNQFINNLDDDITRYLPSLDLKTWNLSGPEWDFGAIGRGILRYFLRELVFNLRLLGQLILIAISITVLQNIQHAFEADTVNHIAFGFCFLIIIGIVLNSYRVTFGVAREALVEMTNFMYAIIPLMFSLIAAGGGITTATIVHPLLISAVGIIAGLVQNIIFPLILFSGILGMVNYLSAGFQINRLANLLKKTALAILGLAMTVFVGMIAIRGFAASVSDSMALRTMKYFSNSFLPVIGGTFSDTVEMATGCSMVLKSGLGVFGLGLIVLITIFPLMKILAVAIVYHLTSVFIQPLGSERLADALQMAGETFINLFAAVSIAGLMFFIAISVLVGVARMGIG